jgi:hypothetical protein
MLGKHAVRAFAAALAQPRDIPPVKKGPETWPSWNRTKAPAARKSPPQRGRRSKGPATRRRPATAVLG